VKPRPPRAAALGGARHTAPRAAPAVVGYGTSGERVRELQARLRLLGLFGRNPTGYYGTVTRASLTAYQRAHGLPATGSVDRRTWTSLRATSCIRRPAIRSPSPTRGV
jgi:peptidoglycan hydrolase-like protein with peptidoglycan-binding domain